MPDIAATVAQHSQPRLDYVTCFSPFGTHRMAYWEWGDPNNDRVLLCVHGLTRTGRDFDVIARHLSAHYRVICPDIVGRGQSDWATNSSSYVIPQYVSDIITLVARLKPASLDWIGTSMGGLVGLGLAGTLAISAAGRPERVVPSVLPPEAGLRLGKVVLNDVGPRLSGNGLERISEYVGRQETFSDFSQALASVRETVAGFGEHTDAQWEALTRNVFFSHDGQWVKHYDLRIAEPLAQQTPLVLQGSEAILWAAYESIHTPVLLVRGQQSDLLTSATAQEMLARNPNASLYEVPEVGHAPTLMAEAQVQRVSEFLLGGRHGRH